MGLAVCLRILELSTMRNEAERQLTLWSWATKDELKRMRQQSEAAESCIFCFPEFDEVHELPFAPALLSLRSGSGGQELVYASLSWPEAVACDNYARKQQGWDKPEDLVPEAPDEVQHPKYWRIMHSFADRGLFED